MIIRFVTQDDMLESAKVSVQSFGGYIQPQDLSLPSDYKILAAFLDDNKTIIAQFEIYEKECCYLKNKFSCALIEGVCVKPEMRHKGIVNQLFDKLSLMEYNVSFLHPCSSSYYEKFGYYSVETVMNLKMNFSNLNVKYNGNITLIDEKNFDCFKDTYYKIPRQRKFDFIKTKNEINLNPFFTNNYCYAYFDEKLSQSAFCEFTVDRENSVLKVTDLLFDGEVALVNILGYIKMYDSNLMNVEFCNVPLDFVVQKYTKNIDDCARQLKNAGAIRMEK